MLFKKILFATDFSETSSRAQNYVVRLKDAGCEEVVLVHVVDLREVSMVRAQPSGVGVPEGVYDAEIVGLMQKQAEQHLDDVRRQLEEGGLRVRPHLISGIPSEEIIRLAGAEGVSLIVVGSHGRSNVAQILLGSVSENVIRHAKQPVLVVRRIES